MFVQIIEGKATSAEAVRAAGEAWNADVRPVADGFLGSTEGVAADGTAVIVARFADRAAAEANNERPEQQAWFEAHKAMFEGEPTFAESEDVEELLDGGSDDAGFVQIMHGSCSDRERASAFERAWEPRLREVRPDLIGGLRLYHENDRFTDVNYFTSEADARANEATMGEQMPEGMAEFNEIVAVDRWIDLTPPTLAFH